MIKKFLYWMMGGALLLPASCSYDDTDVWNAVNDLDQRVDNLEEVVNTLNSNVSTLSQLMTGKLFIESVEDKGNGLRIVHVISANGEKSVIEIRDGAKGDKGETGATGDKGDKGDTGAPGQNGADGKDGKDGQDGQDGVTPIISVKQDSDGNYYWTINGEYLIVDGSKVRANGIDGLDGDKGDKGDKGDQGEPGTPGQNGSDGKNGKNGIAPAFRIENGRWMVSLDRGITWNDCGQATGNDGDAFFKDAQTSDDGKYAFITLADGTVLTFEIYNKFGIAFDLSKVLVQEGQTKDIEFTITGMTADTQIEAIGKKGWDAEARLNNDGSGILTVSAPETPGTGTIIVLLSNGADKTIMRTLTFVSGIVRVSDSVVDVDQAGGTRTVSVETDLEFVINVPDDAYWVKVTNSRAVRTETFLITVDASDAPEARSALLSVETPDGKPLETILIVQQPTTFDPTHLVFRVDPALAPATGVSLPLNNLTVKGGKIYVDWGDGSDVLELTNPTGTSLATADRYPKHVYTDKGRQYSVQVWGDFVQLPGGTATYCAGITEISQWGTNKFTNITLRAENLTAINAAPANDQQFANLSTLRLQGCKALRKIHPKLLTGVTPKNFYSINTMFRDCASLEEIPDGFFDPVTKLTGVQEAFYGCKALRKLSGFKNVTDVGTSYNNSAIGVFRDCESLAELPEQFLPEMLLKRTTTFTNFFANCKSLRAVPDGFFKGVGEGTNANGKIVGVTILNYMFSGCSALESVNIDFLNTPGGLQAYSFTSMFSGCSSLAIDVPAYKWDYNGTTYTVYPWERDSYRSSADADMAAAAKLLFGTRSINGSECFLNATKVKGYENIPASWGGLDDGIKAAPTVKVSGTPTEGAEYYSVDFKINTTEAQEVYYYLATPAAIEKALPRYGNSLERLAVESGSQVKNDWNAKYLDQANSEEGLTLYFDGGMPENDYAIAVVAINSKGKAVAYAETRTEAMPKGSEEYEALAGTWTVTSESTLINKLDANENIIDVGPSTFEVTLIPERVDESYILSGWGLSVFSEHPMRAKFNPTTKSIELWNGTEGGTGIMYNYKFDKNDDPDAIFSTWNVLYFPYLENPNDHTVDYWGSGTNCECILAGSRIASLDRIVLQGQRSAYNSTQLVGDVYWCGMEAVLAMGGPSGSQTWTPKGIIRPENIVTYEGETFVPHHMAPYTMTRKMSARSAVPAKAVKAQAPAAGFKASFR